MQCTYTAKCIRYYLAVSGLIRISYDRGYIICTEISTTCELNKIPWGPRGLTYRRCCWFACVCEHADPGTCHRCDEELSLGSLFLSGPRCQTAQEAVSMCVCVSVRACVSGVYIKHCVTNEVTISGYIWNNSPGLHTYVHTARLQCWVTHAQKWW